MTAPTLDAAVDLARAVDILRVAARAGISTGADADRVAAAGRRYDAVRQVVPCPTCDRPLPGLFAQCEQPGCLTAAVAEDVAVDRRCDL